MVSRGVKKPYIQTLGNSAVSVAGSLHHLRFKKYSILLDCGMAQGFDIMTAYKTNKEQVKKVKTKDVDYIILSHCHQDHSGLIPAMYAKSCHAHVYVPEGSIDFLKLLWEDSLKIHQQDCLKLQHKHNIKASPLFDEDDIAEALNRVIEIPYNEPYKIAEDITLTFIPAGHIIHSAQILVELQDGNIIKRVGYTGDVGGPNLQPYTEPRQDLPFVNVLIGESTYCTPTRPEKARDRSKDIEKLYSAINQFNKILVPCFSLQRTQIMLKLFRDLGINQQIPIYLDSPLAARFCAMWDTSDEWQEIMSRVKVIDSYDASQGLQFSNEHCIILSASGFLTGGRIMNHLKTALPKGNNCLMFIGYAGENNLASQIKQGQKEVNVDGDIIRNNINIIELRSFSSHASYEALMEYYNKLRYDKILLVHGEMDGKIEFAHTLQQKLIEQGKSSRVIASNMDTKISF